MIIGSLDLSMSCPAIITFDTKCEWKFENMTVNYLIGLKKYQIHHSVYNMTGQKLPEYDTNEERWHKIATWCLECTKDCEVVNLESQSYGSIGSSLCQISELHGVIRNYWYRNNIHICLTPPSQNKKQFSGKGNATKLEMIDTFKKKFNIDLLDVYNITSNNLHPVEDIVDAVALLESLYLDNKK